MKPLALAVGLLAVGTASAQSPESRRYLFPRAGNGPPVGVTASPPGYFGPGSLFYAGGPATGSVRPTTYPLAGTPAFGYPGLGYPAYTPGATFGRGVR